MHHARGMGSGKGLGKAGLWRGCLSRLQRCLLCCQLGRWEGQLLRLSHLFRRLYGLYCCDQLCLGVLLLSRKVRIQRVLLEGGRGLVQGGMGSFLLGRRQLRK